MSNEYSAVLNAAVEGSVDEAILRRLVSHVGGELGPTYGKRGKQHLRDRLAGYNNAAEHAPWITLVDLDHDFDCAPPLRNEWLPNPARWMCFRVAVREVEAWLIADHEGIAEYLSLSKATIPRESEDLEDPKRTMVDLARRSRRRDIREGMVPSEGSGRDVGPTYASSLIEFVLNHWSPQRAQHRADSLRRCIERLRCLVEAVHAAWAQEQ